MEALTRYAERGYVEILIPSIVAGEFASNPSSRIQSLAELRKCLNGLKQSFPSDLHAPINEFESRISQAFDNLETTARQRFEEWQRRTGARIVEPAVDHAKTVFNKYFSGSPPFGSAKARTDIPDAFIVEAIIGFATEGELFAVAQDGRVTDALKQTPGITVFGTVKSLLESDEFQDALTDVEIHAGTEFEKANVERIVDEFKRHDTAFHRTLETQVSRLLAGKMVKYRNPHYDERDGPDQLYIDSVEEVSDWTFEESDYLGEGVIIVNFYAKAEVDVDDPLSRPYYDEEGSLDSSRMVEIQGEVSITVEPDDLLRNPEKLSPERLLEEAEVRVDELDDISLVSRPY
jgi:hypothetical protein